MLKDLQRQTTQKVACDLNSQITLVSVNINIITQHLVCIQRGHSRFNAPHQTCKSAYLIPPNISITIQFSSLSILVTSFLAIPMVRDHEPSSNIRTRWTRDGSAADGQRLQMGAAGLGAPKDTGPRYLVATVGRSGAKTADGMTFWSSSHDNQLSGRAMPIPAKERYH